jgi:hypothetical protein
MAANKLVQARVDGAVKEEAAAVLAATSLTVSDAPKDQAGISLSLNGARPIALQTKRP